MQDKLKQLLTDMRCEVVYSHGATMPIPLYERMKETIIEYQLHDEATKVIFKKVYDEGIEKAVKNMEEHCVKMARALGVAYRYITDPQSNRENNSVICKVIAKQMKDALALAGGESE